MNAFPESLVYSVSMSQPCLRGLEDDMAALFEGDHPHYPNWGGQMIRQHIFKGTQPGSREHLEKYLMEQKHSRAKAKQLDVVTVATVSFFAGCLVTLLATFTF